MKITLYTPKGIEYESECRHIQVNDQYTGSFGILENHVPVISTIVNGYILIDSASDEDDRYIVLKGALLKFKNNEASVVTEIYTIGKTLEEAETNLSMYIENRKQENRARNIELALAENELKKQIKKTGAGNIK